MKRAVLVVLVLYAYVSTPAFSLSLFGVSYNFSPYETTLWRVDPMTGNAAPAGLAGLRTLNSLAPAQSGFAYSFSGANPTVLHLLDLGAAIEVSQITVDFGIGSRASGVRGLAASSGGNLVAAVSTYPDLRTFLYKVDSVTGGTTLIADLGQAAIQGLEFAPDGRLFAWGIGKGLLEVDPAAGSYSVVSPLQYRLTNIQTLAFAPNGILYGAGIDLYTIDLQSGVPTSIGSLGGPGIRGLTFVAEPSQSLLLVGSLLCLWSGLRSTQRKREIVTAVS